MLVVLSKIVIVCNDALTLLKIKELLNMDVEVITIDDLTKERKYMNLNSIDMSKILEFYVEKNIYMSTKSSKKNIKNDSHLVKTKTKEYKRRIIYDKSRY